MMDYGDNEEGVVIEEVSDFDFAEEQGELVTCVIQKLLCNQKTPDTAQRH